MGMSALLLAALGGESVQLGGLEGGLAADPLGALAGAGALDLPLKTAHDELADLARWWGERAPRWRAITVDAEIYHDAGASAVLELGLAVATGAEYLRELLERGLSPEQAAATISFRFALGTRFFTEVAKLRAARLLWDAVTTAFGCSEERRAMHVQARSSSFVQSRLDPWVNMIRSTVATCAAAVGGADVLGVSPFDQPLTLPDAFSRRQARNVQVLARDEAYLGRVADPAGGSWYVESLTDELARAAWTLFQQIEERGGMGTALREGFPQAELARTWSAREAAIARRQERLIGASVYPNLKEVVPHRDQISSEELRRRLAEALGALRQTVAAEPRDRAIAELRDAPGGTGARLEAALKAAASGATLGELTRALHPGGSVLVVPAVARGRAAKPFETLRSAADAHASHTGARPRALLAAVGALGPLRARVDFAAGALEVGGFEVLRTEELSSGGAAAEAAARSGCPVLMLCASDNDYPTVVPAVVEQLRAAPRGQGPSRIVLAGRPPKEPGATWASGVDEFVFLGCDIVAALMRLQRGAGLEVLP